MTNKQLLEEAKRRYPKGTVVKPLIISSETGGFLETKWDMVEGGHYWAYGSKCPACMCAERGPGALYLNGTWAPIMENAPFSHFEIY